MLNTLDKQGRKSLTWSFNHWGTCWLVFLCLFVDWLIDVFLSPSDMGGKFYKEDVKENDLGVSNESTQHNLQDRRQVELAKYSKVSWS